MLTRGPIFSYFPHIFPKSVCRSGSIVARSAVPKCWRNAVGKKCQLPLHALTFSLHLRLTTGFHFARRDQMGTAVMALMNARINRRWETRQRRRWMCLKGRILGTSDFCGVKKRKKELDFISGRRLSAWERRRASGKTRRFGRFLRKTVLGGWLDLTWVWPN